MRRRPGTALREPFVRDRLAPEVVARLSGHSGCTVLLCRGGEGHFVRKISSSAGYNERLSRQIAKQERLAATTRTPRVMFVGEVDGLVFFDMEYIRSRALDALVGPDAAVPEAVAERLFAVVEKLAARRDGTLAAERFERKIDSVAAAVAATVHYASHRHVIDRSIVRLRRTSWDDIPRTECHGDFTLENILVDDDGVIALVDALDEDLETVWLDVAKMLHDLESGWSFRHRLWRSAPSSADGPVVRSCRHLRAEFATGAAARFPDVVPRLADLMTLQALRVLPYTEERGTFARIVSSLERYERRTRT